MFPESSFYHLIRAGTNSDFCPNEKLIDGLTIPQKKKANLGITFGLRHILLSDPDQTVSCVNVFIQKPLQNRLKVVRANISQCDNQFPEVSRCRQCAAITAVALVFSELHPVHTWTPEMIDVLIIIGDETYRKSEIRSIEKEEIYLTVDELPKHIEINGQEYQVNYDDIDHHVLGLFDVVNLIAGLRKFFSFCTKMKGMLLAKLYFISVYMETDQDTEKRRYYVLDSHSRDANGLSYDYSGRGTAVLIEFENIHDMAQLIIRNLNVVEQWKTLAVPKNVMFKPFDYRDPEQFNLFPIKIEPISSEDAGVEQTNNQLEKSQTPILVTGEKLTAEETGLIGNT